MTTRTDWIYRADQREISDDMIGFWLFVLCVLVLLVLLCLGDVPRLLGRIADALEQIAKATR